MIAAPEGNRNLEDLNSKTRSRIKCIDEVDNKMMKSPANDEPLTNNSNTKRSKAREELDLAQYPELVFTTRLSPRQVSACKSSIRPSDYI